MSAMRAEAVLPVQGLSPNLSSRPIARPSRNPAARAVVILYATCGLLALAYPQAIAAWLDDFEPNPLVTTAQGGVERLVAVSERLGLAQVSSEVRAMGRRLTRKPD